MVKTRTTKFKTRRGKRLRRFRYGRRKLAYPRINSLTKYNQHHYLRWETTDRTLPLTNVSGINAISMNFYLDLVQNASELTSLYDQYKIKWVKVLMEWSPLVPIPYESNNTWSGSGAANPILYYKRDYDDSNIATESEFKQSNQTRAMRLHPNRTQSIFLRPACNAVLFEGVSGSGYTPKWRQRIDCADSGVPHYGLKMLFKSPNTIPNYGTVLFRVQYAIECYNTR